MNRKLIAAVSGMVIAVSPAVAEEDLADEIVVTASPIERSADDLALPVSKKNQSDLDASTGVSIADMLKDTVGVSQSGFAPGASRPIIRGLDNARVRVQEGGVGLQGVSAISEDHGIPMNPLAATDVEVVRGPATLRYGSEAIGGVVHILTDRIAEQTLEDGPSYEGFASLSSVDDGKSLGLKARAGHSQWVVTGDGFTQTSRDYARPTGGKEVNSFYDSRSAALGVSHLFDAGFVGGAVEGFESKYGIPGIAPGGEPLHIDMHQTRVTLSGSVDFDEGLFDTLRVQGGYSDYAHDEVNRQDGSIGSTFINEDYELRIEALYDGLLGGQGAVGIQGQDQDLRATGEGGELLAPAEGDSLALFVFEEVDLDEGLRFEVSGRIETARRKGFGTRPPRFDGVALPGQSLDRFGRNQTERFTLPSASLGFIWQATDQLQLALTGLYTTRAPAVQELYSKGPHEATETFEIGDPDMKKETSQSAELRVHFGEGPFHVDLSAYYTRFDDFIFKRFTGFVCDDDFDSCGTAGAAGVGNELTQIAFSQQDATFRGFEAEAFWTLLDTDDAGLTLSGQFDLVRAKLDNNGNVPRIPPWRAGVGIDGRIGNVSAGVGFTHVSTQDDLGAQETRTESYDDVQAHLVWNVPVHPGRSLNVGVTGSNLTDQTQRNHVSFKKANVLQPGRNIKVFARIGL